MKTGYFEMFSDAGALWRGERAVLIPIAAIFFFLPEFAMHLFVAVPDLEGLSGEARASAILAFYGSQLPWLAGQFVTQSIGVGALLLMLLDGERPTVGEALSRTLRMLPGLLLARFTALVAVLMGVMLLILPGMYMTGRLFMTSAVYVTEPGRGGIGAVVAGFERTRGNGWHLFTLAFSATMLSFFLGGSSQQMALAAEGAGPLATGVLKALAAAVGAGCMLLVVLLEAAAYRALSRTGT